MFMRFRLCVLTIVFLFSFGSIFAQTFPYKKEQMPFNAPPVQRPIDSQCSDTGSAVKNNQQEQNRAKNNFGATGNPVPIQIGDFDRLQRASEAGLNCFAKNGLNCKKIAVSGGMPSDRNQLRDLTTTSAGASIGEGTIVVLEAKIMDSHYSNTKYNRYGFKNGKVVRGKGESVNCSNTPESNEIDNNDIHIVLAFPGETDECMSVTAEISPHYRPESWRRFHNMRAESANYDINKEAKGVNFKKFQMVRLTGPLFFDASHEPCSPGHRSSPARRSLWEIHPVYKIEVKVNGNWMSFDDWAKDN